MGFFDKIKANLNPKAKQSESFKKEVQEFKTKYVNMSKDELKAKLANTSCEAEKVGITELLYGVGIIGTAVPLLSSLADSMMKATSQDKKSKDKKAQAKEDDASDEKNEDELEEGDEDTGDEEVEEEDDEEDDEYYDE